MRTAVAGEQQSDTDHMHKIYKIYNETHFSYLHKLGATFHAWSRRWFVLDRQRSALIYYSDKSERKPRGGAYFAVSTTK